MKKYLLLILIIISTINFGFSQTASDGDYLIAGSGFASPGGFIFGITVYERQTGSWVSQMSIPLTISGTLWVDGDVSLFGAITVTGDLNVSTASTPFVSGVKQGSVSLGGGLNNYSGSIFSGSAAWANSGAPDNQLGTTLITITGASRSITTLNQWSGNQNTWTLTFSGTSGAEFSIGTDLAANIISFTTNNTLRANDNRILAVQLNISNNSTVSSSKSGTGAANRVFQTSSASNATLDLESGSTIIFQGTAPEIDINTFNDNGTLSFEGGGTQSFVSNVGAASLSTLGNLSISGGGTLQLDENKTISGTLTMNGNIDLNGFNLELGTGTTVRGTLTYTSGIIFNNTGTGNYFRRWFNTDALTSGSSRGQFPVGTRVGGGTNWRRNLFFTGTPTNAGSVDVVYDQEDLVDEGDVVSVADGASTIVRRSRAVWCITTSVNMNSMDLDIEGQGLSVSDLTHLRIMLASSVTGTHVAATGSLSNPRAQRSGISFTASTQLCFYIGSTNTNSNLPVTLISFTGKSNGPAVDLNWRTADEFENDRFEIERSIRGVGSFKRINSVRGKGTTDIAQNYHYTDTEIPAEKGDLIYYRLKQIDKNGTYEYSPIISIRLDESTPIANSWALHNNLYNGDVTLSLIDWELDSTGTYNYSLVSSSGRTLIRSRSTIGNINDEINGALAESASGVYILRINSPKGLEQFKILKQ